MPSILINIKRKPRSWITEMIRASCFAITTFHRSSNRNPETSLRDAIRMICSFNFSLSAFFSISFFASP